MTDTLVNKTLSWKKHKANRSIIALKEISSQLSQCAKAVWNNDSSALTLMRHKGTQAFTWGFRLGVVRCCEECEFPLLCLYPKSSKAATMETSKPIFKNALLTMPKLQTQLRCPLVNENETYAYMYVCIHTYIKTKKDKIMSFAGKRKEVEIIILVK